MSAGDDMIAAIALVALGLAPAVLCIAVGRALEAAADERGWFAPKPAADPLEDRDA